MNTTKHLHFQLSASGGSAGRKLQPHISKLQNSISKKTMSTDSDFEGVLDMIYLLLPAVDIDTQDIESRGRFFPDPLHIA